MKRTIILSGMVLSVNLTAVSQQKETVGVSHWRPEDETGTLNMLWRLFAHCFYLPQLTTLPNHSVSSLVPNSTILL